jgi:chromosome segregation ATPase
MILIPGIASAQVEKKAAEIKRLETGLTTAKNNVAKYEKSLAVSDSLISKGTEQLNESKAETKALGTERKTLDKEYATQRKALEKLSVSKDKAEATQAKTDIKALDLKYKTDSKALDTRLKDTTKKSTTGTSNLSKGKAGKKTAADGLETAQATLDAAQDKYNTATGVAVPEEEGKKKSKAGKE